MNRVAYKTLFNKFRDTNVINRSEQYAKWTLPYLMSDLAQVASSGRVVVERDYQELGALLINNLSAKLTKLLFPTQYPFFQASASAAFERAAAKRGLTPEQLRASFARMEMNANKRLFVNSGYASLILALKFLIATGNALLHRDSKNGTITAYGLNSFVTRRDGTGILLDCILREFTTVEALPSELQSALRTSNSTKYGRPEQTVEKYTRIHRTFRGDVAGYTVSQEIDTISVGDSSWYPTNLCPWLCPTWALVPGEHYGRGLVEDYAGGFARLSSLSESSALYAVEIMRVVHLVGAGSGGDIDDLAQSESGEWVRGDPNNIGVHEAGDAGKLQQVVQEIERVTTRLAKAFMYQGASRDAERVTAYELQRDAQEAEYSLGGVYSTLSGGMQVPLAHQLMVEVSEVALAGMIAGELSADVTAGIPALGRSAEVQNFLLAAQEIAGVAPIAQLDKRFNPQKIVDMILAGRSIDNTTVFFTPEEQRKNADANANIQQGQAGLVAADTLANNQQQLTQTLGG